MAQEHLQALIADVDRLITAGASLAAGDDGLRKRDKELRDLGKKVPALVPVAGRVRKVLDAKDSEAPRALLDLLLATRQIRASLAGAGVEGTLEPVPASGPWETNVPAHDIYPVAETLGKSGGASWIKLVEARDNGFALDLRLVSLLLKTLDTRDEHLAYLVADQLLPAYGSALSQELQGCLNLKGKVADARRLMVLSQVDSKSALKLSRRAFLEGSLDVQQAALWVLLEHGPREEVEENALAFLEQRARLEKLKKGYICETAAQVLNEIGAHSSRAITIFFMNMKEGPESLIGDEAAKALGKIGKSIVPALIKLLKDPNTIFWSIRALQHAGSAAAEALPALIELLENSPDPIWWIHNIFEVLEGLGSKAKTAVPCLTQLLLKKNLIVRAKSARALLKITGDSRIPAASLVETLKRALKQDFSERDEIFLDALKTLPLLGDLAVPAIPLLIEYCKQDVTTMRVRDEVKEFLIAIGKQNDAVLKVLLKNLNPEDVHLRFDVRRILSEIGPSAKAAIPRYIKLLKNKNADTRQNAAEELGEIKIDPDQAIPALMKALGDKDHHVRYSAAYALGHYGAAARVAVPALQKARQDPNEWVSKAVAWALKDIEGDG